MGLFNFNKNKGKGLKSPIEFYSECVADFHNEAAKHNIAKKGLIFIPELIPKGEKIVLSYLKDPFFQIQSGGDALQYYYTIMALSISAGICSATRWHEQLSTLDQYVEEIIVNGPAEDANNIISNYLPKDTMGYQGNDFFQIIFKRWLEMYMPYSKFSDSREYIFKAMIAAYQLGVSMILEKFGF